MFGAPEETILKNASSAKEIIEKIEEWKNLPKTKDSFKVESYNRLIFDKEKIAIDFGDYSHFLLVDGVTPELRGEFTSV